MQGAVLRAQADARDLPAVLGKTPTANNHAAGGVMPVAGLINIILERYDQRRWIIYGDE